MPASGSSPTSSGRTSRRTRSTRACTRWRPRSPGRSSPSSSSRWPRARAPTRWPTAAPARATTRSGSTSPSMPSTRASRSSPRCGSGWACRATRRSTTRRRAGSRSRSPGRRRTRSTSTCGAARARRASSRTRGRRPRPTPSNGRSTRARRRRPSRSRSPSRAASPSRSTASGSIPSLLIDRISTLAGQHGVGRIDHVEDRLVGIKSREIYEAPAATVLHAGHRALEGLTLTKDTLRFNRLVADELAQLTYDGLWFSALHRDLRGYVASSERVVSGDARIRLDHGSAVLVGRRSPLSLYDKSLATYDEGDAFDHAAAVGFIEIFGLPLRVEAARHGAVGRHHGAAWTWTDPLLDSLPMTRRGGRGRAGGLSDRPCPSRPGSAS